LWKHGHTHKKVGLLFLLLPSEMSSHKRKQVVTAVTGSEAKASTAPPPPLLTPQSTPLALQLAFTNTSSDTSADNDVSLLEHTFVKRVKQPTSSAPARVRFSTLTTTNATSTGALAATAATTTTSDTLQLPCAVPVSNHNSISAVPGKKTIFSL
jgi:hypothetical protein